MRIAAARLHPYALPLKRPWVAAAATLHTRRGALLSLTTDDGLTGWGDCAPLPSTGADTHQRILTTLAEASRALPGLPTDAALARVAAIPAPEVCWAVETALFDLVARQHGQPLATLLGARPDTALPINAALGPLDAGCATRAATALAQGYHVAKIKVGIGAVDLELERLHALNAAVGGRLRLRLDANRAWPLDDAQRFLHAIAHLPIDAVEEPLAHPSLAQLASLQRPLPYPLAIDESLPHFGADAVLASGAIRRLVIKPARIGGITTTRDLAARARAAGIDVVLTSVIDTAIGVTATAHLAAALSPQLAHGLATGDWLTADVATPLPIHGGLWTPAHSAGLGLMGGDVQNLEDLLD